MDNLTHGLLGLAIGALRPPDGPAREEKGRFTSPTDRAVLLGALIASELPDLDSFWPEPDPVLHALRAHRGISHALLMAPAWAIVATGIACLIFRRARIRPVFLFSLLAVAFAHLAADLWTGWGTRILLPFSNERLSLDFVSVIDPVFTLPLLAGALWALVRRWQWRRALVVGLACSSAYLCLRITSREILTARVEAAYPQASRVDVFPALLAVTTWRYAVAVPQGMAVGEAPLFGPPREEALHPPPAPLPPLARENPTVEEALAWARFPLQRAVPLEGGELEVRVADLRYHLRGQPTLEFVILLGPSGETLRAGMARGGSAKELLRRWRRGG